MGDRRCLGVQQADSLSDPLYLYQFVSVVRSISVSISRKTHEIHPVEIRMVLKVLKHIAVIHPRTDEVPRRRKDS